MNPIVYHIVSGQAFFSGVGMIVAAAFCSLRPSGAARRCSSLLLLLGLIAVVLSSTPLSYWWYASAAGTSGLWILSLVRKQKQKQKQKPAALLTILAWSALAFLELPYHVSPSLTPVASRSIAVIGDSVTAGVDGDETAETWPSLLARTHQVNVEDVSHIGETCGSALKRVQSRGITSPLVVVEIGGNDVLGSTSPTQFASDLDALLKALAENGREVVMFELPLPPFYHEFGRAQREVASRYGVSLIPKRTFLSVIAGGDSTLDSIHLTQKGHQLMADIVWAIIEPALPAEPAK